MPILQALVIGWLPGAILLRLPVLDRPRRAALPAEERTFWAVIISIALSLALTMMLGAFGWYSLPRLVACDVAVVVVAAAAAGFRLGFGGTARRIGIPALIPIAILLFAGMRFFPSDEYLIGGKDPGVYMNEGIQIAQRGSLTIRDQTVRSVPASVRNLFFPDYHNPNYYSLRFMGFFVQNPRTGTVVGQFPHLYPASIAIGYGLDGLTGARAVVGIWALLGVAALYFLGTQLAGRPAAAAAAFLLSLHVLEVWYAKYPNSEMMMQPLLLSALLAADRAFDRDDRFFGIVAGVLLGMQTALRVEAALGIAAAIAVAAAAFARRRRIPWSMFVPLALLSALGIVYLIEVLPGYAYYPVGFARDWILPPLAAGAVIVAVLLVWVRRRESRVARFERWLPRLIAAASVLALAYGWFLRVPRPGTAPFDAAALRTYTVFYFSVPVLIAAVAGFILLTTRRFWHAAATLSTLAIFCAFFFYKIRIVPEHFWMGRRLIPLILPGVLLAASHFALVGLRVPGVARRVVTSVAGIVFLGLVGAEYARVARPLLSHVEYAGIVPQLERLASRFGDDDLVIAESTNAGTDIHVLAVPLAYTYG
ncbi:MAG TPA: glycosyltransferase family 39 protein, partial [Vicinamibacterales bacterium]|nr:glycosyltransferase family 39 protein [Vicinamibacterales bacterium]